MNNEKRMINKDEMMELLQLYLRLYNDERKDTYKDPFLLQLIEDMQRRLKEYEKEE